MLDLEILEHPFNHQITLREIVDRRGADPVRRDTVDLRLREFSFFDGLGKKCQRLFARFVDCVAARIEYYGAKPGTRSDDGDARAHRAAPGNTNRFDVHIIF